jgi:hypothetical protein
MPSMHPIFIARGPAFKKKYVTSPFETVNVYSLICHLLDISPRPNNGSLDTIKHMLSDSDNLDITMITCKFFFLQTLGSFAITLTRLTAEPQQVLCYVFGSVLQTLLEYRCETIGIENSHRISVFV